MNEVKDILDKERVIQVQCQKKAKKLQEVRRRRTIESSSPEDASKPFFVLSVDGGGLRGIINCVLLQRLVEVFPSLLERVQMVAGCSNGGMIAMCIAYGYSASTCQELLECSGRWLFLNKKSSLKQSKYSNHLLKILCDQIWREKTLKHACKYLVIPAFLMANNHEEEDKRTCEVCVFHNMMVEVAANNADPFVDPSEAERAAVRDMSTVRYGSRRYRVEHELASDVVMRTTAAPTYFPAWQKYVDGGVFAHDPSSEALKYAISPQHLEVPIRDIAMLSFGTGMVRHHFDDEAYDWGYVQWVPVLGSVLWDGMIQKSESFSRELLGEKYHRVNPELPDEIPMDDPLQIPALVEIARNVDLGPTVAWIREHVYGSAE
eukprot:TRINITY_DN2873_c0_g1_i4.p1 TRINITY_DN2873_c0_g1~~TRINITY_DN2873_c0_g1_i4.p1  ORF type:complete len:376 (+),score=142.56 TRINITY_DN2873_c0_g1_i4:375-1502(+)